VDANSEAGMDRGTSLIINSPPPQGHHRALGIILLQGPRGSRFLMSEVLLYAAGGPMPVHFRAKREHLKRLNGTVPESRGQNLVWFGV